MAREKFQTLTEQMFYILLCLQEECYGMDIMEKVAAMTEGRVTIGPGTLYNLLEQFQKAGILPKPGWRGGNAATRSPKRDWICWRRNINV